MLPEDERDDFLWGVPWGPGTSDEYGVPWENRNGLYDSLGKDGNLCKSPTLKDILNQRTLEAKCDHLLGFDILLERSARIIHYCNYVTYEVEVVLRPNENEMRGNCTWKWGGVSQLPECIVVGGKSCQYVCVLWMNEGVMYGLDEGRPDLWYLLFNDTPDFDDIEPCINRKSLNELEDAFFDMHDIFLHVVPDFVIHNFWQPEQHHYLQLLAALKRMTNFGTNDFFSNTVPKHFNCSFLTLENLSPVFARDEELAHFKETQIISSIPQNEPIIYTA